MKRLVEKVEHLKGSVKAKEEKIDKKIQFVSYLKDLAKKERQDGKLLHVDDKKQDQEIVRHVSEEVPQENVWEKVKSNHDFTQQCKERVTHLAATHQRFTQPKTLEACYQSVDTPRKEDQSKMARLHQHPRHYTARRIKFEETTIEGERKSRLEGELSEHNNAGGCSQLVEQQFDTHGGATATRDVKLAEHSLRLDMMDYKDTNGVLLWKITDIRRRRRDAVSATA
ncbi:uncharacterized protein LOC134196444 isoform X4 [Corticium candelabrum]|uniref:uncharacterized protein LOC134196444 isoform X4 n=1 Tax=Corticium candelabrum TaxID=121492 RepID=UPI002E25C8A5|nr:uncharacterized protein LOC134196444 isoform X4 [Corticium candelabrum]XP_062521557.1 uncharacterized protein LOC134196444 isoform X4 [Corticium candelabrum]